MATMNNNNINALVPTSYKCAQCEQVFPTLSARERHGRSEHQAICTVRNAQGDFVQIERLNQHFTCPSRFCGYTTTKANLMHSHYTVCRHKVRMNAALPQPKQKLMVPTKMLTDTTHLKGWSVKTKN